jgi:hypothetical protein
VRSKRVRNGCWIRDVGSLALDCTIDSRGNDMSWDLLRHDTTLHLALERFA